MKKAYRVATNILFILLAIIAFATALSVFGFPRQLRLFVVQSGSMHPAIPAGSLVAIVPSSYYGVNDVITFKTEEEADIKNPKALITHRIVEIKTREDGTSYFLTKGDANESADGRETDESLVLGKAVFSIPYFGYPVGFAKTQTGFILLIVIPATIIVYSELLNIKNEVRRILLARKSRDKHKKQKMSYKLKKRLFAVVAKIGIACLVFNLPLIPLTNAYFSDQKKVEGNTVSAGWWVPPSVTVLSPNGEEIWPAGSIQNITWTASSSDPLATVTIDIYYSTDSGVTYPYVIATGEANDGVYSWTLPGTESKTMRVKIVATDSHGLVGEDTSDGDFDPINGDLVGPAVSITSLSPNPTDINPTIIANATDLASNIKDAYYDLYYSRPGEPDYHLVLDNVVMDAQDGSFDSKSEVIKAEIDISSLIEGEYFLYIFATDTSGNLGAHLPIVLIIDRSLSKNVPTLEFYLRKDKKAVGFKVENIAAYESLRYEIVYDTNNGDRGIVGNIKIDGQDTILRDNLVLGTCSGIEGKVCTYDQGVTKINIKVTLADIDGKEKILEEEINL